MELYPHASESEWNLTPKWRDGLKREAWVLSCRDSWGSQRNGADNGVGEVPGACKYSFNWLEGLGHSKRLTSGLQPYVQLLRSWRRWASFYTLHALMKQNWFPLLCACQAVKPLKSAFVFMYLYFLFSRTFCSVF